MMSLLRLVFLYFLLVNGLNAQVPKLLSPDDSLFIEISPSQTFLIHTVKKGHTVYGINRYYGTDAADLYFSNPELESNNGLKIGQKLKIPAVRKVLQRRKPKRNQDTAFAKVYYRVKSKETLWRISKVHFKMPVEILKSRNQLKSMELYKGQVLHVGWFNRSGIPDSLSRYTGLSGVLADENTRLRKKYDARLMNGKEEILLEGPASWPRHQDIGMDNSLYVLCSSSPKGSVIRIENPMTERKLYAKVLGPVPNSSFARGSIVVLSPTVAQALGVLDAKVYVRVHYLK